MAVKKAGGVSVKDKVAAAAGKDVATQGSNKPKTLREQLQLMVPEFSRAMPKHMDPERLARIALTLYRQTPGLAECTPESFFGALMQAAQLGCEPGNLGLSYLVPYRNNKTKTREVQFILGYKGMLDLVRRSGQVIGSPRAMIVYENDQWEYNITDPDATVHVRWDMRKDIEKNEAGKIIGAYVLVRYIVGGRDVIFTSMSDIMKRKARSKARDNGPWKTDEEAMILKTAVRAAFTWMPISVEVASHVAAADGNVTTIARGTEFSQIMDLSDETIQLPTGETVTGDGEVIEEAEVEPVESNETAGADTASEQSSAGDQKLF